MGRRKIEIQPITHERNRSVTFLKRKNGLFKKAYELGVLCSVDIAVIIFEDRPGHGVKLYQYGSSDPTRILQRQLRFDGDRDTKLPRDFNGAAGDDGDDDDIIEEEEPPAPEPEPEPTPPPPPRRAPSPPPQTESSTSRKRTRRGTATIADEPAAPPPRPNGHASVSPAADYAMDVDALRSFSQGGGMHPGYGPSQPQPGSTTFHQLQSLFHPGPPSGPHDGPYAEHHARGPHLTGSFGEPLRPSSLRMLQEGYYTPMGAGGHGMGTRAPHSAGGRFDYGMDAASNFDWPVHNAQPQPPPRNSHHQASPIQPPSNDAWYDFLAITNPAPIGAFPSGLPGSAHPSPVSILHPQGASSFRGQSALYSGGPNPLATDAPTSSALRSPRTDARAPRTTSRRRHTAASVTPTVSQSGAAISTNVSWERGGGSANGGKGAAAPKAPSRPSTTGPTPAVAELAAEALADSVLALTSLASSGGKRAEESDEAKPKAKGSEEGKDSAGT